MKKHLYLVLISLFALNSCSDDIVSTESPDDALIRPILFLSGTSNFNTIDTDEISIQNVQIVNDVLIIDATYPGGCDIHSTALFSRTGFLETSPVQLSMKLIHHSYTDTCSNIISEKFYFDLKSVATLYNLAYRDDSGTVLLNILDSDSTNYYLPQPEYEF